MKQIIEVRNEFGVLAFSFPIEKEELSIPKEKGSVRVQVNAWEIISRRTGIQVADGVWWSCLN